MGKLGVFNFVTLNGFYEGAAGDISWHRHGEEEGKFSEESVKTGGMLLFGRVTYQMMASFWPTPDALGMFPVVADGMNKADKVVFSRTMKKVEWNNTRLVKDNLVEEIRRMKETSLKDMTILGSGSIVTQCAEQGLIDSYQIMVDPVVMGNGTPMFKGISHKLDLKLISTRTFNSGAVLLCYEPLGN